MAINLQEIGRLTDEVLDGVTNGDFDNVEQIPEKYTYGHLLSVFYSVDSLEGGDDIFRNLHTIIGEGAKTQVRRVARERQVRVAFLTFSAAEWQAESLYRLLKTDDAFETYVVVSPIAGRDENARTVTYRETYTWYESRGYDVRGGMDVTTGQDKSWKELGGIPDIVIHLTSWFDSVSDPLCLTSLPLKCLNLYIPYGMETTESPMGTYMQEWVCNSVFANLMWRIYEDTERTVKEYKKYGLLQAKNVICSGFPKMDYFYEKSGSDTDETIRTIWGMSDAIDIGAYKRVIIAPHHSLLPNQPLQFSAFRENAQFLLETARRHADDIFFAFKPHPNLRYVSVEAGVFRDYDAYDAYIASWKALPNAHVITESNYLDLFDTSDAMIMDSCSFIGEYLYANKPMLFLAREGQAFTALGEKCMTAHETVSGSDFDGIEQFLQRTVLQGEDKKREDADACLMKNWITERIIT